MSSVVTTGVLDPAPYDAYARMVQRLLDVPVALVTLVEPERQWFPGAVGLPAEVEAVRETPLSHSVCQYVVADASPLVIEDTRLDDRLRTNGAVVDLDVIAYAGWPLTDHAGLVVGSLCAIDHRPRAWSEDDLAVLEDVAAACSAALSERRLRELASESARRAHDLSSRSRVLLALSEALSATLTLTDVAAALQRTALEQLGCLRAGLWVTDAHDPIRSADLPLAQPATRGMLRYVSPAGDTWGSARLNHALGLDDSNPVGESVLEQRPLSFADAATQNARYPTLDYSEQVGQARSFWPLVERGEVLGAMALVWEERRVLTDDELVTLGALAAYTAQAARRALLTGSQADSLVTLQRALLPRLPEGGALSLAARYRPAAERDQVGGDWYDAVTLASGATSLMIGDVVGHDVAAAATMGTLRTMLRALTWSHGDATAQNVSRLDAAMRDLGVEGMATLVHLWVQPDTGDGARPGDAVLRWTNAGHVPPLLLDPHGTARLLAPEPADLMVGVDATVERREHTARVEAGSTLLLYTDGLIERRRESIDAGLARLVAVAARHHALALPDFLDAVLADAADDSDHAHDDDVALLAVRFTG